MAQALYRKWRPQTFDAVVGQEHVVQTLHNAVVSGRVAHAYLFSGPRGTGKTTMARLLAKAVNCLNPDPARRPDDTCAICAAISEGRLLDLIELDAASNRGIDEIRDLRDKIYFAPSEARYKVYVVDECFRYEDWVTLGDGSRMPIGKIVEEGLHVEVLSYNESTRRIEPKPVVRHMRKRPTLPTVRITFDNNRVLVCTLNHKFYSPDGLKRAGELEPGQFVYAGHERITEHQLAVIAGAALGDGHIALTASHMRARLSITQGAAQVDYLDYKTLLLGDLIQTPPVYQDLPTSYSTVGTYRVATVSRPTIAELHRELYGRNGRRHITRAYLDRLTPLGLALWYLDDGSLITQPNPYSRKDGTVANYPAVRSTLSVNSFSDEEAQLIRRWLQERWNIEGGVSATAKGPVIWLTLEGTRQLHKLIAPYVPPSMAYKLLPAYRGRFCLPIDAQIPAGLAVSIVKRIERVPAPDWVYNIEVADNHNYFARDILVANCHMLTEPAFNALLKTLEEPPPHAIFVLATTDPQKVPVTIVSRCQPFAFRRLTLDEIVSHLRGLIDAEGLQADPQALALIARQATGSMRDAISLLDQLAAGGEAISVERAQDVLGTGALEHVMALADALAAGDAASGLNAINAAIDGGADARQLARQIVDYLRGLMLVTLGDSAQVNAPSEQRARMEAQAARLDLDRLVRATRLFNQAASELKTGWQPQLPLELAYLEALNRATPAAPASPPASGAPPAQPRSASPAAAPSKPAPARSAAARSEATTATADAPAASLKFDDVSTRWPAVLSELRSRSVQTWGLMNSCQLVGAEGDAVVLQWPSTTLRDIFERGKDKRLVEDVIGEVLGQRVRARCVVEDDPVVQEARRLGGHIRPVTNGS